jgi:hypothetical protein
MAASAGRDAPDEVAHRLRGDAEEDEHDDGDGDAGQRRDEPIDQALRLGPGCREIDVRGVLLFRSGTFPNQG